MSKHFNLTNEKWIPVVTRSGQQEEASLERIFTDTEILDLVVSPCERISLMALFTAIANAALEGPANLQDWQHLPQTLPVAVARYLGKWRDSFDLWSADKPFLQLPGLLPKEAKHKLGLASKLDFAAASGSNSCLFDNAMNQQNPRLYRDAELALRLLTFQCFSPGGLIGIVRWRDLDSGAKKTSESAPYAVEGVWHGYVQRGSLLDTLIFNLPTRAQVVDQGWREWGRPIWEQMPQAYDDAAAIANATRTYLGRLIPLSRSILLMPDLQHLVLGNGLRYPRNLPALPTLTLHQGEALSSKGRPAWQEVPAFSAADKAERGGVMALGRIGEGDSARLWLGALSCRMSKILGEPQALLDLDGALLSSVGRSRYAAGIALAEKQAKLLNSACKAYRKRLESQSQDYPEAQQAKRCFWQELERQQIHLRAWARAEVAADVLLKKSAWRQILRSTAAEVYRTVCPFGSARRRFASIQGLNVLDKKPSQRMELPHE